MFTHFCLCLFLVLLWAQKESKRLVNIHKDAVSNQGNILFALFLRLLHLIYIFYYSHCMIVMLSTPCLSVNNIFQVYWLHFQLNNWYHISCCILPYMAVWQLINISCICMTCKVVKYFVTDWQVLYYCWSAINSSSLVRNYAQHKCVLTEDVIERT